MPTEACAQNITERILTGSRKDLSREKVSQMRWQTIEEAMEDDGKEDGRRWNTRPGDAMVYDGRKDGT